MSAFLIKRIITCFSFSCNYMQSNIFWETSLAISFSNITTTLPPTNQVKLNGSYFVYFLKCGPSTLNIIISECQLCVKLSNMTLLVLLRFNLLSKITNPIYIQNGIGFPWNKIHLDGSVKTFSECLCHVFKYDKSKKSIWVTSDHHDWPPLFLHPRDDHRHYWHDWSQSLLWCIGWQRNSKPSFLAKGDDVWWWFRVDAGNSNAS